MKQCMLIVWMVLVLFAFPCHSASKIPQVVSVDMQVLLGESAPGKAGTKHIMQVRAVLEKGYEDLKTMHKDAPQEEQKRTFAEGLATLNRQMAIEQAAASQVVMAIVVEEVEKWRKANGVSLVIPRSVVIAGDWVDADYTKTLLGAVNKRTATFSQLPVVTVKNLETGKK